MTSTTKPQIPNATITATRGKSSSRKRIFIYLSVKFAEIRLRSITHLHRASRLGRTGPSFGKTKIDRKVEANTTTRHQQCTVGGSNLRGTRSAHTVVKIKDFCQRF